MRQKSAQSNASVEKAVRDIRRKTRRRHSTEERIRIVLEGFRGRGEHRLAVSPRRYRGEPVLQLVEGVSGSGQGRLAGDTAREATSQEVKMLRAEARALKAEKMLENRLLKKSMIGDEEGESRMTGDHPPGRSHIGVRPTLAKLGIPKTTF